jgi:hypothetical protein
MYYSEKLPTCIDIENLNNVENGKMSYCMVAYRPHFFILIEDNTTTNTTYYAFSYVPESVYRYIIDKTVNNYPGYYPWNFTTSYVVNSNKFVTDFIRLKTIPIKNWQYERYPEFKTYNVLTSIPYLGISDCIGYSNYHYNLVKL